MILVAGHFRIPCEHLEAARPSMRAVIAATHREDGCLSYSYAEDVSEPGLIRVMETWRNRACLDAHLHTPHMARWIAERADFGLCDRDIKVWETGEGEAL